jgi:hypothetical protein
VLIISINRHCWATASHLLRMGAQQGVGVGGGGLRKCGQTRGRGQKGRYRRKKKSSWEQKP